MFYHRGITHSFCFAAALGAVVAWGGFRAAEWRGQRLRLWLAFSLITASHGLLDALSTYAGPIAYFAPFSSARFTSMWHPLGANHVRGSIFAMIGHVIAQELVLLWLPSLLLLMLILGVQRRQRA